MYIAGIKDGGVEPPPKKSQTQDMELQDLVFDLLGPSLTLMQYFLTTPPFLPNSLLCHCMLEGDILLFDVTGKLD